MVPLTDCAPKQENRPNGRAACPTISGMAGRHLEKLWLQVFWALPENQQQSAPRHFGRASTMRRDYRGSDAASSHHHVCEQARRFVMAVISRRRETTARTHYVFFWSGARILWRRLFLVLGSRALRTSSLSTKELKAMLASSATARRCCLPQNSSM